MSWQDISDKFKAYQEQLDAIREIVAEMPHETHQSLTELVGSTTTLVHSKECPRCRLEAVLESKAQTAG